MLGVYANQKDVHKCEAAVLVEVYQEGLIMAGANCFDKHILGQFLILVICVQVY